MAIKIELAKEGESEMAAASMKVLKGELAKVAWGKQLSRTQKLAIRKFVASTIEEARAAGRAHYYVSWDDTVGGETEVFEHPDFVPAEKIVAALVADINMNLECEYLG